MAMPASVRGVANLIGLGEILGLASFGTGVELFGDQCLQRCMLGRLGRAISGTAGSAGGHHGSASGSRPKVSSMARTASSASRTSALAVSESARSASCESNVLPERMAVKRSRRLHQTH